MLKKHALSLSSKEYAKQNLNVESISYKTGVQEGLRLRNFYLLQYALFFSNNIAPDK